MEVTVKDRQTMLDLQLICCGSMEGIIDNCALNGISVTDDLADGQTVAMGDMAVASVVKTYSNKAYSPATAIDSTGEVKYGGIGYMAVGIDFIVS